MMPPGGQNPLGHIRFNFFNRLTVFQHDTPDQYLFAHVVRAESHGCMRVQDAPNTPKSLPVSCALRSSGQQASAVFTPAAPSTRSRVGVGADLDPT